jgi:hypothetical protein
VHLTAVASADNNVGLVSPSTETARVRISVSPTDALHAAPVCGIASSLHGAGGAALATTAQAGTYDELVPVPSLGELLARCTVNVSLPYAGSAMSAAANATLSVDVSLGGVSLWSSSTVLVRYAAFSAALAASTPWTDVQAAADSTAALSFALSSISHAALNVTLFACCAPSSNCSALTGLAALPSSGTTTGWVHGITVAPSALLGALNDAAASCSRIEGRADALAALLAAGWSVTRSAALAASASDAPLLNVSAAVAVQWTDAGPWFPSGPLRSLSAVSRVYFHSGVVWAGAGGAVRALAGTCVSLGASFRASSAAAVATASAERGWARVSTNSSVLRVCDSWAMAACSDYAGALKLFSSADGDVATVPALVAALADVVLCGSELAGAADGGSLARVEVFLRVAGNLTGAASVTVAPAATVSLLTAWTATYEGANASVAAVCGARYVCRWRRRRRRRRSMLTLRVRLWSRERYRHAAPRHNRRGRPRQRRRIGAR